MKPKDVCLRPETLDTDAVDIGALGRWQRRPRSKGVMMSEGDQIKCHQDWATVRPLGVPCLASSVELCHEGLELPIFLSRENGGEIRFELER